MVMTETLGAYGSDIQGPIEDTATDKVHLAAYPEVLKWHTKCTHVASLVHSEEHVARPARQYVSSHLIPGSGGTPVLQATRQSPIQAMLAGSARCGQRKSNLPQHI